MRPFALWGTKIAPLFSPSPSREGINPAKYHHRFSRSHAKPQPDRWKQLCKGKSLSGQKLQSRQGAGPLYMKPMLHCDKLYEICASDLDKGGNANGPEEQQGVEEFSVLDEGDPVSHHVDKVALQPHGNENPTAPKGRKRVFADVDNLETSLCNVPNSFAKFLEAEKENGMQMAMMNTVQT
uniref:Uncharacterized protein n=1 Tax=Oryza meridionalis TaxID=40149 RepID=A0A0E0E0N9_9ORYZ